MHDGGRMREAAHASDRQARRRRWAGGARAPSSASKTGTVATLVKSRMLQTVTTLSRPPDSRVQPSGERLSEVTAEKWALRTAGRKGGEGQGWAV